MEARLIELEIRYTQQQELLEQLHLALVAQQQQLDALARGVAGLQRRLEAEPGQVERDRGDEPPPHY